MVVKLVAQSSPSNVVPATHLSFYQTTSDLCGEILPSQADKTEHKD